MAEQRPVILFNRNRFKSFQFTLYHRYVCTGSRCFCQRVAAKESDRRGEWDMVEDSIFIPPKGYSRPLPATVLNVPQVQQAMKEPLFIEQANRLAEVQVFEPKPRR